MSPLCSQEALIDSIYTHHKLKDSNNLEDLESVIDSLLKEKNTSTGILIELYEDRLDRTDRYQTVTSQYFSAILLYIKKEENTLGHSREAISSIEKIPSYESSNKWVERRIKLLHNIALIHTKSGNKEEALEIRYKIAEEVNKLLTISPEKKLEKYHILNYYAISSLFLFDNDEVSCAYADSTIYWALRFGDPTYIYSGYSIKYYCKYYSDDGPVLNTIADSCIKYAVILDDTRKKGEAYMHKCNALVVLNDVSKGLEYCKLSVAAYAEVSDSNYLASTLHNMGNVFKKAGDPKKALVFYKQAFGYVAKDNFQPYYNSMEAIASELFELEEYKESAEYYNEFTDKYYAYYQDQLNTKFAEAEAKYQNEKKEAEIVKQNLLIAQQESKNKTYSAGIIALLSIGGLLSFIFYTRNKRKQEAASIELHAEQQRANDLENINKLKPISLITYRMK